MEISDDVFETTKKALELWGEHDQRNMAIGEIGELLELFGKEVQGRAGKAQWADEIADVYVVLPALVMIHANRKEVEARVEEKIERLEEIMSHEIDHPHNHE